MKAPEKIYLVKDENTDKPMDYWYTATTDDSKVEYTRTDAFIEKAVDKFKQLMYDQHFFEGMVYQDAIIENLVGYFKNYMEGE